jgi:hypothetical protein
MAIRTYKFTSQHEEFLPANIHSESKKIQILFKNPDGAIQYCPLVIGPTDIDEEKIDSFELENAHTLYVRVKCKGRPKVLYEEMTLDQLKNMTGTINPEQTSQMEKMVYRGCGTQPETIVYVPKTRPKCGTEEEEPDVYPCHTQPRPRCGTQRDKK